MMNKLFTITVIILTLTGSLRALEGSPFFRQPAFDPFPKSSGTNTRQNLPSADITQSYLTTSQTWENSWKMTAEHNAQNQLISVTVWAWNSAIEDWEQIDRMAEIQYRSDGLPLSSVIQQWSGSAWVTFGPINYHYEGDLLKHVRYDCYIDGALRPYWHLYYEYLPPFNILDKTVEMWFNGNDMPYVRRNVFTWLSANQPTQIDESVMDRFGPWGLIRHTFVYHDLDQTSHASYLKSLIFGWPFYLAPGLQPVMLVEQRGFVEDQTGIPERHRYFFEYNEANELAYRRHYERDTNPPWSQTREYVYEHEDGLQSLVTYYDTTSNKIGYIPRTRTFSYYTQGSSNPEPDTAPASLELMVSPNPFKDNTTISFTLSQPAAVKLQIFNIKGQLVFEQMLAERASGKHQLDWDGKDSKGTRCGGGIYLYKIQSGRYSSGKKMILLR